MGDDPDKWYMLSNIGQWNVVKEKQLDFFLGDWLSRSVSTLVAWDKLVHWSEWNTLDEL